MNRRHFIAALGAAQLAASGERARAATAKPVRITRIRLSTLQGRFQKFVAMNAYDKAPKGYTYEHTLIRVETDQGLEGIGAGTYAIADGSYAASLRPLIGANLLDLYRFDRGRIGGRNPVFAVPLPNN